MITSPSKSLFASIVVGYAGLTTVFVPLFVIVFAAKFGLWHGLAAILVIPIVAILQGLLVAGVVTLGLWLVRMMKPSWVQL
jgi:hypothetical protein